MFGYMKKYTPEDYFVWMGFFFKLLGVQPPKDNKKKFLYLLVAVPHLTLTLLLGTILEWTHMILHFREDFTVTMFSLTFCVFHAFIILRTMHWFSYGAKIDELIEAIQRNTFEFECFGIYNIDWDGVFERAREVEAARKYLTYENLRSAWTYAKIFVDHKRNAVERFRREKMTKCRLLCCGLYLSYTISGAFSLVLLYWNVLGKEYQQFNPRINTTSTYGTYPFQLYLPFDTSLSHGHYWFGYFYQMYVQCSVSFLILALEWFFMNSIIHLIHQVTVIEEAFKKVDDNIDYSQSRKMVLLLQEIRIVRCMDELQDIYRIVALFEGLFSGVMLVDALQMTCIICSLTYTIAMLDITDYRCMVIIFVLILGTGQIFSKCFCCQALSTQFENTLRSICCLEWTQYSPKMRKNLLLLITRVQKPAPITAGKFFRVGLALFVQVVQKSYSFYTLVSKTTNQ